MVFNNSNSELEDKIMDHEEISEIMEGSLYLSGWHCRGEELNGQCISSLKYRNVEVVFDLSGMTNLMEEPDIIYRHFSIRDRKDEKITPIMEKIYEEIIQIWDKKPSCKILIHCQQGISRSATVVVYLLMKTKQMTLKDAFMLCKGKRRVILPNVGFLNELIEAEQNLYGRTTLQLGRYGQLLWLQELADP